MRRESSRDIFFFGIMMVIVVVDVRIVIEMDGDKLMTESSEQKRAEVRLIC